MEEIRLELALASSMLDDYQVFLHQMLQFNIGDLVLHQSTLNKFFSIFNKHLLNTYYVLDSGITEIDNKWMSIEYV